MDSIDKEIVESLREDARTPFLKIAEDLKVSEGTVRNRVSKLLSQGIVKRFTIEMGPAGGVSGIVGIKTEPRKSTLALSQSISKLVGVASTYEVSGEFDILALVESFTLAELNFILEKIRSLNGVIDTQTFMIMKRVS